MSALKNAFALVVAASTALAAPPAPAAAPAKAPEAKKFTVDSKKSMPPGLDEGALDLTADPCNDFYQYACGGWLKANPIPAERSQYSRGFVSIAERNEKLLHDLLDEAAAGKLPKGTPFATQMGDYYGTCMDEAKLETAMPEVKKYIASVANVKSPNDLAKSVGKLQADGISPFFNAGSDQDLKISTDMILNLDQGGLGLPDRDYYVDEVGKPDPKKDEIRASYLAYIAQIFELAGEKPAQAKQDAESVMALETRLAKASMTRVEQRDPTKLYNRLERKGLKDQAGAFNWDAYLSAYGAKDVQKIYVTNPTFFKELSAIAKDTKPEVLNPYLTFVVLRSTVPALPKAFQEAAFAFDAKNFSGAKEDRPRWKKCVHFADADMGEALGREFTRRYFGEDSKARTVAMVNAMLKSFEEDVGTLAWMDDATRGAALTKARGMVGNNKIGYPNTWRDYSGLKTTKTSFFANSLAANRFETKRNLAKIGKPVDRNEWGMSPPTVNAYYNPQKNEIVFPAGILQPPFFNKEATDAVNFGAMGMVVGHELTHGFDDQGRQFDADGNLKDWWSDKVGKDFVTRADCVRKQYDGYTAVNKDTHLNGALTLGENIADFGGLKIAYGAMENWYTAKNGGDDSYRYDRPQQFYLGFAQSWCTNMRDELSLVRVKTDPHSPPNWRVNGPLGNLDAFNKAFQCGESAKIVRRGADRCSVW